MPTPPCATNPQMWDLDQATADDVRLAVDICTSCPLRTHCNTTAEQLRATGYPPRAQVCAGTGFDESGAPLTYRQVQSYAATRRGPRGSRQRVAA